MCKSYSHWGLFEDPIEAQNASSVPFQRGTERAKELAQRVVDEQGVGE